MADFKIVTPMRSAGWDFEHGFDLYHGTVAMQYKMRQMTELGK